MKRLTLDGEETAKTQSMTSATKRERKLHYRGNLISANQLSNARQPIADADRLRVAQTAQQLVDKFEMTPDVALAMVLKRLKWEERNRWSVIRRWTHSHLQESQEN